MQENEHSRIEDIKRRLYDREDTVTNRPREGVLHQVHHQVDSSWKEDNVKESDSNNTKMRKPSTSFSKKFFTAALVFFLFAIGFAFYMYSTGGSSVSNDKIDITVLGNAFTKGGDDLPLQVEINNRNNASLELADLVVEYPSGASDESNSVIRLPRDTIGTIKAGQIVTRNITVKLFGDEKSVRNIKVSLEYHPEGSNAIFTKEKDYGVTISSAPLSLNIEAPTEVTSDQVISLNIEARLNTSLPTGNTMLQVKYPSGFVFDSATPAPYIGNSVWDISSLSTTAPININIKGRLVGQDGDQQAFHVYAGTNTNTDQSTVNVVYNSLLQIVSITKPFLEAHILVNNQDLPTYTVSGSGPVNAQVSWVNNLPTRITDAQIIVTFSGNAFDKTKVNPLEGFYNSQNYTIVWDKNTIPDLASVEPGGRGNLSFTFNPLSLIGSSLKDPQIALDVSIRGTQPSLGSVLADVNNVSKKVVKIASDLQIASSASFSSGSRPPKAETETKYTVTWTLSNSANSVNQAQARSVLPIYVKWVGPAPISNNENISYNASTREVVWNIGSVAPNTGFGSNREASFILSLTPSLSQVGSVPQLMKDVILTGQDAFTNTAIRSSRGPITTSLSNDPSFKSGDERVVE
jgi:hypothetical protein